MSKSPSDPDENSDPDGNTLIFQWRGRPWRVWRLAVIIFVSLVAHAATFYLLQVSYTPTGSLQPPSAQVVLLAPETPAERAALNQWLKVADPALLTSPQPPATQDVLDQLRFRYVPSYTAAPPAFKSLEPPAGEVNPVPERSRRPGPVFVAPGEFLSPVESMVPPAGNAAAAEPTRLVFRGPVAPLAPSALPPLEFTASQRGRPLEPTVYLVGVPPGGGAPWLFRQPAAGDSTLGDATLDEAAREYLARLLFAAPAADGDNPRATTWGWATFSWGREIYRGK